MFKITPEAISDAAYIISEVRKLDFALKAIAEAEYKPHDVYYLHVDKRFSMPNGLNISFTFSTTEMEEFIKSRRKPLIDKLVSMGVDIQ